MRHELILKVAGQTFGGWTAVRVHRGIDRLCGEFELELTQFWPGQNEERSILPGAACTVIVDGQAVITGYVDELDVHHDARTHSVAVRGRCKTADLVDCSAVHKPGSWSKHTLAQLATALAKPFGVQVLDEVVDKTSFSVFSLQQGESAFEALERAARIRGVLMTSNGKGDLVITRPGRRMAPTELRLGVNIIEASTRVNVRDRYSTYTVKGQSVGGDFWSGKAAAAASAQATDLGVQRYRPLVLISEAQGTGPALMQRAKWESTVRAARSLEASVRVQGWAHSGGLWDPNLSVKVVDPLQQLADTLLVHGVTFQLDETGTTCELHLTRQGAFNPEPPKAPQKKKGSAAFWAPAGAGQ